ncbi:hypothetical protein [Streptomyces lavendulae]|uniref:hypothetical protein n=1 Tax=Streptomyces lavendulae TaxID=1914 RepID=UPI0036A6C728
MTRVTRGPRGCVAALVAGPATGLLGALLPAAAWRACGVGVNGAANSFALTFCGGLLAIVATVWWGALIRYTGRQNPAVALLGGTAGAALMVWIFVAVLRVPDGYHC